MPEFADAGEAVTARASLPDRANGQTHVEDRATGTSIDFALVGAKNSVGQVVDGYVLYPKGHAGGAIYQRAEPSGVEDYLAFDGRPASPSIAYDMALGPKVAGLRLVGNQLEMLDGAGAPRLRVAPPYVVGVDGALTDAILTVEGCAVDADPAGPWGRTVTPPGARRCRVRVSWADEAVVYPALLDPRWQTTGSLSVARQDHSLIYLPLTGKVLAVGGRSSPTSTIGLASAELFDKDTGTWSATSSMSGGRWSASATLLGSSSNGTTSQKVLIAGGINGTASLNTARLYNQTAGTWATAGTLNAPRHLHTATRLYDGRVLVCGGMNGSTVLTSAALYNPASGSGSWAATTGPIPPPGWRSGTATLIQTSNGQLNNKVLLAGGNSGTSTISAVFLFDPAQSAFSTLASMPSPREGHQAVTLSDGRILFSGGKNGSTYLASSVIFDPSWGPGNWTTAGNMTSPRWGHAMNLLPTAVLHLGLVLVSGGSNGTSTLSSTEYWNGTNWATDGMMVAPVQRHGSVALGNSILIAGGAINNGSTTVSAAEVYDPSIGLGCTSGSQCASGFCVSGVCCNSACSGGCGSCNLAGHLGICTPLTSGSVCRALAGGCDVAETCDGTSVTCPFDAFQPSTTVCRPPAGICDVAEVCDGTNAGCPPDGFLQASMTCRPSAGLCDPSEECSGTSAFCQDDVSIGPPASPTGLAATPGSHQVALSWNGPPDAKSFAIKRGTATGGPYTLVAAGITGTYFVDTGLTEGTAYYYVLTATSDCGESASSTEVLAVPAVLNQLETGEAAIMLAAQRQGGSPPDLRISIPGLHTVWLEWDSVAGADSYLVLRLPETTTTAQTIAEVTAIDGKPTYDLQDTELAPPGSAVCYSVDATAAGVSVAFSGPVCTVIPNGNVASALAHSNATMQGGTISVKADPSTGDSYVDAQLVASGDSFEVALDLMPTNAYNVRLTILKGPARGRFQALVGGNNQGPEVDGYAATDQAAIIDLGQFDNWNALGNNILTIKSTGSDGSSYAVGIASVIFTPLGVRAEAESAFTSVSSGTASNTTTSEASGSSISQVSFSGPGSIANYKVSIPNSGKYRVLVRSARGPLIGKWQLSVDPSAGETTPTVFGLIDGFSPTNDYQLTDLGFLTLTVSQINEQRNFHVTYIADHPGGSSSHAVWLDHIDLRTVASSCDGAFNSTACDDGSACNTNDHCTSHFCVGGPPLGCDDQDECTVDYCEPSVGCQTIYSPPPASTCGIFSTNVIPILNCLATSGDGTFRAVFGYSNNTAQNISIPPNDSSNQLRRNDQRIYDPIVPRWFPKGQKSGVVILPFAAGETVTWAIGANSATASQTSVPTCTIDEVNGTVTQSDGGTFSLPGPQVASYEATASQILDTDDGTSSPVGKINGDFAVTDDGSATYHIPLWVPAGRGGLQPKLSLDYSSSAGDGLLGVGWNLGGLSRLMRCPSDHARDGQPREIRFDNQDKLCLDGQRLVLISGDYNRTNSEYRTEIDSHIKIVQLGEDVYGPTAFDAYLPDGTIQRLGATPDGNHNAIITGWEVAVTADQTNDTASPTVQPWNRMVRLGWGIQSLRDRYDNHIDYSYFQGETLDAPWGAGSVTVSDFRPAEICYNFKEASSSPQANTCISFKYGASGTRQDIRWSFVHGAAVRTGYLLTEISVRGPNPVTFGKLKLYNLHYIDEPTRALLDTVSECDGKGSCLPPTTFGWTPSVDTFTKKDLNLTETVDFGGLKYPPPYDPRFEWLKFKVGDYNGDGLDDILLGDKLIVSELDSVGNWNFQVPAQPHSDVPNDMNNPSSYIYAVDINADGMSDPMWRTFVEWYNAVPQSEAYCPGNSQWTDGAWTPQFNTANPESCPNLVLWGRGQIPPYVGDFDGDGLPDLIRAYWPGNVSCPYWSYLPNTPVGFATTTLPILDTGDYFDATHPPGNCEYQNLPQGSWPTPGGVDWTQNGYMLDVNGDGKLEFVFWDDASIDTTPGILGTARMRLFNGPTSGPLPTTLRRSIPGVNNLGPDMEAGCNAIHYQFADVNGDGLPDALEIPNRGGDIRIAINTGRDFLPPMAMSLSTSAQVGQSMDVLSNAQAVGRMPIDPGLRLADLNSDGRADILQMGSACRNVGNGDLWNPGPSERTHLIAALSQPASVGTASFATSELVNAAGQAIALGDKTRVSAGRYNGEPDCGGGYGMSATLDLNGDGLVDMIQLEGTVETNTTDKGSQLIIPGKLVAYIRNGKRPGMLSSVTDGLGNNTHVEWAPLSDSTVYSKATSPCTYPQYCNVRGKWVVQSHTLEHGSPTARTLKHNYVGARKDITGIGWLGMDSHTVTDTSNGNTVTNSYDHTNRVNNLYPHGQVPKERLETFQIATGQNIWKVRSHQCPYTSETATGRVYATDCLDGLVEWETEPSNPAQPVLTRKVVTTESYDPTYGYPLTRTTDVGVASDPSLRERSTWTPTYWNSGNEYTSWLIGLLWKEQETSSVPASTIAGRTERESKTRSIEYARDASTGAVTNIYVEPPSMTGDSYDPSQYRVTSYLRNAHGQVVKVTESTGSEVRTTTTTWDPVEGVFPSTVTNSLGQTTSTIHHPGLGVLLQVTDVGGLSTNFEYDGFGRSRKATNTQGDTTVTNYDSSDSIPYIVHTFAHGSVYRGEYYSAQGRKTEVHSRDEAGQDFIAQAITYDSHGRVVDVRRPSYAGGTPSGTSVGYDVMGRPTYKTDGVGYKSWSYIANNIFQYTRGPTVSGATTVDQQELIGVDEQGRVVSRAEYVGAMPTTPGDPIGTVHPVSTDYVYGPFGVLEDVLNTNGTPIHVDYDNLGRAKRSTDLNRGTWTRVFDGFGQLREETQVGGPALTFNYDLLGRKTSETTGQGTSAFLWDLAVNGPGKLAATVSADGVKQEYIYDGFGNLATELLSVSGETFSIDLSYDLAGRPSRITYPAVDGTRIAAKYDYSPKTGQLSSVKDLKDNQLWHAAARNLDFLATSETFGDQVTATRSYEPQRGYLTAQTVAKASGEMIASIAYTHDVRGNLDTRLNYFTGVAEKFTHDELGRLRHWTDQANAWSLHYDYDDLGNMTSRHWKFAGGAPDSITTYATKPGAGPNQLGYETLDSGPPREYVYDSAGRQISGPNRTATYTDFDLPIIIQQQQPGGLESWSFKYDAHHARVLKASDGGTSTLYFGGLYERRTTPTQVTHVMYVPGERGAVVAQVTQDEGGGDSQLEYLHDDPIGSPTVITSSFVGNTQVGFEPFGQRARGTGPTAPGAVPPESTIGFGGHEQEEDLGLINMGGRIYDPSLARFLTPDPLVSWPIYSQSYNPYIYGMNSPFRFVDPTGFGEEDAGSGAPPVDAGSFDPGLGLVGMLYETWNPPDPYRDLGLGGGSARDAGADAAASLDSSIGSASTNGGPSLNDTSFAHRRSGTGFDLMSPHQYTTGGGALFGKMPMVAAAAAVGIPAAVGAAEAVGGAAATWAVAHRGTIMFGTAVITGINGQSIGGGGAAKALGGICFVAGTPIATTKGTVPIEEVGVGDLVLSRDPQTGRQEYRKVQRTFVTANQKILTIKVRASHGTQSTLGATGTHPFWVIDRGWVRASELRPGDLLSTSNFDALEVSALAEGAWSTVYNFEVEGFHTYFAGAQGGVWVHNSCENTAKVLSQNIVDDIGRLGLGAADKMAARQGAFRIIDAIASQGLKTLQEVKKAFPGNTLHPMETNLAGWHSLDLMSGNRSAFGGARLLLKRVADGWEFMVRNTHNK